MRERPAYHGIGKTGRIVLLILLAVGLASPCFGGGHHGDKAAKPERADLVTIDGMKALGPLERPPVQFKHDGHTEKLLSEGQTCAACHLSLQDGRLSQKFLRLENGSRDALMELYHEKCIGCHTERKAKGLATGAVTCGGCHARDPEYASNAQEVGFDKSLHWRHIEAVGRKCESCHHEYDPKAEKTVYKKGHERSCRDCHKEDTETRSGMKTAGHWSCIGCHLATDGKSRKTGPVDCAGCHHPDRQAAVKTLNTVPRLPRNQPDRVMVAASAADAGLARMPVAPFNHEIHENATDTCRVCHHEGMQACNQCHTLEGHSQGGGVKLEMAMHDMDSDHSCVGCHNAKKAETACVGCHKIMDQSRLPESACLRCHYGPKPEEYSKHRLVETVMRDVDAIGEDAEETDLSHEGRDGESTWLTGEMLNRTAPLSFAESDIPETVTVNVLESQYGPAAFPHRKIVYSMLKAVRESKMAMHFHGSEDALCQGCHHNSPVGKKPPMCRSCHGQPFNADKIHVPGLKGAYHQQCMGCHQAMKIEPVGCTGCHERKSNPMEKIDRAGR